MAGLVVNFHQISNSLRWTSVDTPWDRMALPETLLDVCRGLYPSYMHSRIFARAYEGRVYSCDVEVTDSDIRIAEQSLQHHRLLRYPLLYHPHHKTRPK